MADACRTEDQYVKGFRKRARRNVIPSMPTLPAETFPIRSEAYELAVTNRHKPWARRYLRSIGSLR